MNFFLSSDKLSNETDRLRSLLPKNGRRVGYVPNAMDFTGVDAGRLKEEIAKELGVLGEIGFELEMLDLRPYFGKKAELKAKLDSLGGVWMRGGNVFVLRQAMRLSGLDEAIRLSLWRKDFLYAGSSAGCCVLSPDLRAYSIVDRHDDYTYAEIKETVWEGLDLINLAFLPHYDSEHPESEDIDREIRNCIEKKILFKAFRDGEALIFERHEL